MTRVAWLAYKRLQGKSYTQKALSIPIDIESETRAPGDHQKRPELLLAFQTLNEYTMVSSWRIGDRLGGGGGGAGGFAK